jgi:hypothetical protein
MDDFNNEDSKDMSSIKIRPFPGPSFQNHKQAFPTWSPHLIGAARDAGPGEQGHVGLVISAASFQATYGAAFAPAPDPGAADPNATPANAAIHQLALRTYNREQRFVKPFRNKMNNAIDEAAQITLGTPEELAMMHPRDILAGLERHYGTVSSTELTIELAKLSIPITKPEEWMAALGLHMTVHRLHLRNHQPIGENAKIEYMKQALSTIGYFDSAIERFEHDRPLLHNERTFNNFVTKMNIAHSMVKAEEPLTAASLYGKKRGESSISDPNNFERASKKANYAGAASIAPTQDENPKSSSGGFEELKLNLLKEVKAMMSKEKKSFNHYCWSHGTGNHDSKSCKYVKPGHVATATAKNKCGGCELVFKKRKN